MAKRIVVAGGAGFIGSHLCELLITEGFEVVVVDNFITGEALNLADLPRGKMRLMVRDVSDPLAIDGDVWAVMHLASPASPIDYQRHPIDTLRAGSFATHELLDLAVRKKARFLLASTSEVYGDPLVHPQREDYWGNVNPIGLRSCYDEAKRYAEAATYAYQRVHGLDVRVARIFNTYGPRMRLNDGRIVPSFMVQAMKGEPLTVFGDGTQTRSFCYVTDTIDGLLRLLLSDVTEPVNIGNPAEVSVLAFAQAVADAVGVPLRVQHHPLPADDPRVRCPDITRASSRLMWAPRVTLPQGLADTSRDFARRIRDSRPTTDEGEFHVEQPTLARATR